MTKAKREKLIDQELKALLADGAFDFKVSTIFIEEVKDCENQGEAFIQVSLSKNENIQLAIAKVLYFEKANRKENELNRKLLLKEKDVRAMVREVKKMLSSTIRKEAKEEIDDCILNLILSLYKQDQKEMK